MDKSCKNCSKSDDCTMYDYSKRIGVIDKHNENWGCSDFELKNKTVKLYAYIDTSSRFNCGMLIHLDKLVNNSFTRVPSEDKEIQI